MTRDEAVEVLKERYLTCVGIGLDNHANRVNEAIDMAIKALSADAEHDGCDSCRYEQNTEYEYPCSECKQRYKDMWEQKPNDFIEVVRCKDCKHYSVEGATQFGWCNALEMPTDEQRFCADGERKEP